MCEGGVLQSSSFAGFAIGDTSPAQARPPLNRRGVLLVDTQRGILQCPPSNENIRYPTCFPPLELSRGVRH